jgi:ATP-binding cassette subfamily C protein
MIANLAELAAQQLETLGVSEVVLANKPLVLSDASSAWLVESGKVEVFTVQLAQGEPAGPRTHFLSAEQGSAFFGLDHETAGYDHGFLAVGKAGSVLRRYDLNKLQIYAAIVEHRQRVSKLVSEWVTALSKRLTQDVPGIPDPEILLRSGEEVEVPLEKATATGHHLVWVEIPAAQFLFDGMASLSWEAEGVLFPLAPGSWLELIGGQETVKLEPKSTYEVIDDPRLWAGLSVFHNVLMECEFLNKRLAVVDEFNRLQQKQEQAVLAREAGVGAIQAVLAGADRWEPRSFEVTDLGPIFQACKALGNAVGINVVKPIGDLKNLTYDEVIGTIAMSSRFRIRKVALVDDWWTREQGPLLAQRDDDKMPIPLVPKRGGKYMIIDPEGERRPLTPAEAATFAPFAFSFYRRFPDGPLNVKGVASFGFKGLGSDFREVGIMAVATGMLGTVLPKITGMVFDQAIPQAERALLAQLCFGLILVAVSSSLFSVVQNVAMMRVQGLMDYATQSAVWDRLLELPATFFRKYSAGDLSDRAMAINKIRRIIAGAGIAAILGTFASFFNAIQMLGYNAKLAFVAIGLTGVYVGMTAGCNYLKLRLERNEMHRTGKIMGMVLQLINGVAKLRITGAEDHAFRVWATEFSQMRRVAFGVGRVGNFMPVINKGWPVISALVIYFTLVTLKAKAAEAGQPLEFSTGDFLAFFAAYGVFSGAMNALGDASVQMMRVVPIFERLKPILEAIPEIDGSKAAPAKLKGGIEISHVSFRYTEDGPWILRDVSLKIEPGQFVAFVGGSGSGKSTMMKAMLGFEKPQQGSIYYDGQDLGTLDVRQLRQQLGVVLQESKLLPSDIYRNIVGSSARTVAEAWTAATKAGLAEDIKKMPMGMHTYVAEGGGGFSGGQKQRLMIARALVNEPKIIFLDEATSALDNKTQAQVTESMDRLQATRIVIAHRLSTIQNADKICYLEKGNLVEQGTYQELMALNGYFAELARRQVA